MLLDALKAGGIQHGFQKHYWNIGSIIQFASILSSAVVMGVVVDFSLSYGYTPAQLAYDIDRGVK